MRPFPAGMYGFCRLRSTHRWRYRCVSLEWPWRGAFEIDAVLVKTAPMAGAFKLLLRFQPIRRATQVCAHTLEGKYFLLPVVFGIHNPNAKLGFEPLFNLTGREFVGS